MLCPSMNHRACHFKAALSPPSSCRLVPPALGTGCQESILLIFQEESRSPSKQGRVWASATYLKAVASSDLFALAYWSFGSMVQDGQGRGRLTAFLPSLLLNLAPLGTAFLGG